MNKIVEERDALQDKLDSAIERWEKSRAKRKSVEDAFLAMEKMESDDNKEYDK